MSIRRVAPRLSPPSSRRSGPVGASSRSSGDEASAAPREQEAHGPVAEAAGRERQCVGRGRIEPLDVVDRHEQRRAVGEATQDVEESEGDRPLSGRRPLGLRAQQRDLERSPLGSRNVGDGGGIDAVEQVGQRGEGELGLGVARPRAEDVQAVLARRLAAGFPECRLADTRPTDEHERSHGRTPATKSRSTPSSSSRPTTARPVSMMLTAAVTLFQRVIPRSRPTRKPCASRAAVRLPATGASAGSRTRRS